MRRTAVAGLVAAVAVTSILPSAASAQSSCEQRAHDRRVAGTLLGAVGGGLLGNAVSHGGGRTGGTLIGAGVGAVVGHSLARTNCYHPRAYYRTRGASLTAYALVARRPRLRHCAQRLPLTRARLFTMTPPADWFICRSRSAASGMAGMRTSSLALGPRGPSGLAGCDDAQRTGMSAGASRTSCMPFPAVAQTRNNRTRLARWPAQRAADRRGPRGCA